MKKIFIILLCYSCLLSSQDLSGEWIKKTNYSTFILSFNPLENTEFYSFEVTGNTYTYDHFTKDTVNFPAHIGFSYGDKELYYVISFQKNDNHLYAYYNDKKSRDKESYEELYHDDEEPCQFEFYVFRDSVIVNAHPMCNFMYGGYSTNFTGTYLKQ